MKKILVSVYVVLFAAAGFGLVTAWSSNSAVSASNVSVPSINVRVPSISENFIVDTNYYDLIAKKIFSKFLTKYPNFIDQVSCENSDSHVAKIIKKTKIKFRKPDINKENIIKNKFWDLLRDYINDKLECDDFWDVDWDDTEIGTQESVKCLFNNDLNYADSNMSQNLQSCYSSDGKWSCVWVDSCTVKVSWIVWENIKWKSSCGWYAYTTIDWENEYAKFDCPRSNPVPMPVCGDNWVSCINPIYERKAIDELGKALNVR